MAVRSISKKQNLKSYKKNYSNQSKGIVSALLAIILFIVLLWDITGPYGLWKLYHLRHKYDTIFMKNIQLDKKNQELRNTIAMLKSNHEFQEKWIRKNLGWVKNNELLFVFISRNSD